MFPQFLILCLTTSGLQMELHTASPQDIINFRAAAVRAYYSNPPKGLISQIQAKLLQRGNDKEIHALKQITDVIPTLEITDKTIDGLSVTLDLDLMDSEFSEYMPIDYKCDHWVKLNVFTILVANPPKGFTIEIPNKVEQDSNLTCSFTFNIMAVKVEAPEHPLDLPMVRDASWKKLKVPEEHSITWGQFMNKGYKQSAFASRVPEMNKLAKHALQMSQEQPTNYESWYAHALVLRKVLEIVARQSTLDEERQVWLQSVHDRTGRPIPVESVNLASKDLMLNVFNVAYAPTTPDESQYRPLDFSLHNPHTVEELKDDFKELAEKLGVENETWTIMGAQGEAGFTTPDVDVNSIDQWVEGNTEKDPKWEKEEYNILVQMLKIYKWLDQMDADRARVLFESHIISNGQACEDRAKAGFLNLSSLFKIDHLDQKANKYMDNLIDLLLQEHKKFIIQTYLQDKNEQHEAKSDESVEVYLKRISLLDHVFNLGGTSGQQAHDIDAGSYASIIDKFFQEDWFSFTAIFEQVIFQNELVTDWCRIQNTAEFGWREALDFSTRDPQGMIKYCIFTKTNFVKKYLMTAKDNASSFVDKFDAVHSLAADVEDLKRDINAKTKSSLGICKDLLKVLNSPAMAEELETNYRNILDSRRLAGLGKRAWPAKFAQQLTGLNSGNGYEFKKEMIRAFIDQKLKSSFPRKVLPASITGLQLRNIVERYQKSLEDRIQH